MRLRAGQSKRWAGGLSGVALVAAAFLVASLGGQAAAGADSGWKRCGRATYGGGLFIYAKDIGCKKARRIAREAGENLGDCINEGCRASDFTCRAKPNRIEGGDIICIRGEQRVKFGYGG